MSVVCKGSINHCNLHPKISYQGYGLVVLDNP